MKRLLTFSLTFLMIFAFAGNAFAAKAVSKMAITKGGKYVAQCAKKMDKGVSQCAKLTECTQEGHKF